jgi:hypothetical protein
MSHCCGTGFQRIHPKTQKIHIRILPGCDIKSMYIAETKSQTTNYKAEHYWYVMNIITLRRLHFISKGFFTYEHANWITKALASSKNLIERNINLPRAAAQWPWKRRQGSNLARAKMFSEKMVLCNNNKQFALFVFYKITKLSHWQKSLNNTPYLTPIYLTFVRRYM